MERLNQNRFAKWIIIVLLAVNILTVSIIWMQSMQKEEYSPTKAVPPQRTVELMQKTIGLTDEQAKQFAIMREDHFAKRRMAESQLAPLNKQIFEEVFKDKKDTARISNLYSQLGAKLTEIEKLRIEHFAQLAEICNKEQKEKLKELLINIVDRPEPFAQPGNQPPPRHESGENPPPPIH